MRPFAVNRNEAYDMLANNAKRRKTGAYYGPKLYIVGAKLYIVGAKLYKAESKLYIARAKLYIAGPEWYFSEAGAGFSKTRRAAHSGASLRPAGGPDQGPYTHQTP